MGIFLASNILVFHNLLIIYGSALKHDVNVITSLESENVSSTSFCLHLQDEDYDELEEERILNEKDEDEYVLSKMCEVMRAIFATYKTEALPLFQQLMVHVVKLLVSF